MRSLESGVSAGDDWTVRGHLVDRWRTAGLEGRLKQIKTTEAAFVEMLAVIYPVFYSPAALLSVCNHFSSLQGIQEPFPFGHS